MPGQRGGDDGCEHRGAHQVGHHSVRRLRIRSTHAPAGRPMTRNAAVSAALSAPICHAVASRRLHGEDRQRQAGELGAELAERVAEPQPPEVGVVDQ